ncbi:hypothetical protein ACQZ6F_33315 [Rhizobium sp. A22-96]
MMLQLMVAGRRVSAIPDWLVRREVAALDVRHVRIGQSGIQKSIHLGLRDGDDTVDFIAGFLATSRQASA